MLGVEQVIDIYDKNIIWFRIPGYPGYEISNTNYIRSFKSRKKYPYGTLVKWDKKGNVIISNSNNIRVKLSIEEIWSIVKHNPEVIVNTIDTQNTSRNPFCTVNTNAEVEVGKVAAKPKVTTKEEASFVDFSNIPDIDLNNFV